jgi:hypothetical protein
MDEFELIVIGTGTAAQTAAGRVRKAGRSVAIVDHRPFGGTCEVRGCVPKKMLVSGAEAIDLSRRMQGHGVTGGLHIDCLLEIKDGPVPPEELVKAILEIGIAAAITSLAGGLHAARRRLPAPSAAWQGGARSAIAGIEG